MGFHSKLVSQKAVVKNISNHSESTHVGMNDNPNIKRLNKDGAFTMSSSQIFGSKDMIMSASYYDFKSQYKKLVEVLEKTDSSIVFDKLYTIIKNKAIPLKNNEKLRLHPDIIENLKQLFRHVDNMHNLLRGYVFYHSFVFN